MVSLGTGRTLAALLLTFFAASAEHAALAQSSAATLPDDAEQRQIVERIQKLQAADGPASPSLVEPLSELARLYEDRREYAAAMETVGRAQQIVRENLGLYSIEQAPLVQQTVRIEKSSGDSAAAWALEQELLTLANRHLDDLRTVPIFHALGDERMDLLERYTAGELPPELVLGCYYKDPDLALARQDCAAGSRHNAIRAMFVDALTKYLQAIDTLSRNQAYSSEELRELEMKIVLGSYEQGDYQTGKDSLRRLLSYDAAAAAPRTTRIESLVRMADWDLMFTRYGRLSTTYWRGQKYLDCDPHCTPPPPADTLDTALQTYEQAYSALVSAQPGDESIARIFAPQTPVVLPTFAPSPLVSEETARSTGYIDVAFDVAKDGSPRRITVLGTTNSASAAAKKQLVRAIKDSVFRPRVVDGEVADAAAVTLRYYLTE